MPETLPSDEESRAGTRDWPHAPPHRLGAAGVYFVTARTLDRIGYFGDPGRLDLVQDRLLGLAGQYGWKLEAWAVLSNHYHFVGHSPATEAGGRSLRALLKHLHADVTRQINRLDGLQGRKIWHNYRESHLTFQKSYLARLNYTHRNAVHHGLVLQAEDYPWCSASDFGKSCSPAWVKTVGSFRYDQIAREDGE
jgi:putative transposase